MITLPDDVSKLFNDVLHEICQNVRRMMEELWTDWSHLGVEDSLKIDYINKLVAIEKDHHRDVMSDAKEKLQLMQAQVDKLKEETEELSKCLCADIPIPDFKKEEMMLFEYKKELEEQIVMYRERVQQRRMKRERLLEWQRDLVDKLGVPFHELQEMPSEDELDKLKTRLEILQTERDKRVAVFLSTQMEINKIMDKLQIRPQNKFEHVVVSSLSVDFKSTDLNMDRLAKLQQHLQEKFERTNDRVAGLRARLAQLWDGLGEEQVRREGFVRAHPGCHARTEAAVKAEIKRCELVHRSQKIQECIASARAQIAAVWDKALYGAEARAEFAPYRRDEYTEHTLALHQIYLHQITGFYNENKHIFELVAARRELWLRMAELEARATEPARFQNRGGELLWEERERNAIANKLPRIEEQLRALVAEYEARGGGSGSAGGEPLLQRIARAAEWETREAERRNKVSPREQALTPPPPALRRSPATSLLGEPRRTDTAGAVCLLGERKRAATAGAVCLLGQRRRTATAGAAGLAAAEIHRPPPRRQLVTGGADRAMPATSSNVSALKRAAASAAGTTGKRCMSGRIAARAGAGGAGGAAGGGPGERELDHGAGVVGTKTPKVNASILKHKRTSLGKRRSGGGGRRSGDGDALLTARAGTDSGTDSGTD